MDCACGDDAEDGSEDERNKEEDREKWSEEDGEDKEKDEERRKEDEPPEEEGKEVGWIKNLFQPASNKFSNCRTQPIAETLKGCDDFSSKETASCNVSSRTGSVSIILRRKMMPGGNRIKNGKLMM